MAKQTTRERTKRRRYGDQEIRSYRNGRLNKGMIDNFVKLLSVHGLPPDGCCDYLGISNSTFHTWIQKGKEYLEDPEANPEWRIYGIFVQRTRKAAAMYRLKCLKRMHRCAGDKGEGSWQAWMTILERRDRQSFSRIDQGAHDAEDYNADDRFL